MNGGCNFNTIVNIYFTEISMSTVGNFYLVSTGFLSSHVLLWKAYKHASNLRASALMSPQAKPEQFAILVRDIPDVPERNRSILILRPSTLIHFTDHWLSQTTKR
ncbi:hypothetical protein EV2_004820 [Malus domestica]